MAEGDLNTQAQQQQMNKEEEERLKYLELVQVGTVYVVVGLAKLYGYAKSKSGPLKPSVETVEGTVRNVVGPVCHKYHALPIHLLKFLDRKVDASVTELERRVPPTLKVSSQATAASAWRGLNKVASVYNSTVVSTAEKGYKVSSYLPLVPLDKIAHPAH